jgi:hypothetical protein
VSVTESCNGILKDLRLSEDEVYDKLENAEWTGMIPTSRPMPGKALADPQAKVANRGAPESYTTVGIKPGAPKSYTRGGGIHG